MCLCEVRFTTVLYPGGLQLIYNLLYIYSYRRFVCTCLLIIVLIIIPSHTYSSKTIKNMTVTNAQT